MQERGELLLLSLTCHSSYTSQRLGHAFPELCPARALLYRIPLCPRPSLHQLRSQSPSFVRRLLSYYDGVLTSRIRSSSAMAPRLPDADQELLTTGQTQDLPVPGQRASTHARFFDHAGSSGHSRSCARLYCFPPSQKRRHPGYEFLRGSMAGLCAPLPTLRRRPHGRLRTAPGQCGSRLLHCVGLAPTTRCRSPGALRKIFSLHTTLHRLIL